MCQRARMSESVNVLAIPFCVSGVFSVSKCEKSIVVDAQIMWGADWWNGKVLQTALEKGFHVRYDGDQAGEEDEWVHSDRIRGTQHT